ncbi:MAG: hypothetical protein R2806_09880 [Saprospiraceae bacterium]
MKWVLIAGLVLGQIIDLNANVVDSIFFQLRRKLLIVHAQINGVEQNLVLDTGIGDLILNKKYYKGKKANIVLTGINTSKSDIYYCYVDFALRSVTLLNSFALITDLNSLERKTQMQIHGLIGVKVLKKYNVILDYMDSLILLSCEKDLNILIGNKEDRFYFKYQGILPNIVTVINGKYYKWNLDSGATINVIGDHCHFRFKDMLVDGTYTNLHSFGSKATLSRHGYIRNLPISLWLLEPMETVVTNMEKYNEANAGKRTDGILGYEFLKQMVVEINFRDKEIYLYPKDGLQMSFYLRNAYISCSL